MKLKRLLIQIQNRWITKKKERKKEGIRKEEKEKEDGDEEKGKNENKMEIKEGKKEMMATGKKITEDEGE